MTGLCFAASADKDCNRPGSSPGGIYEILRFYETNRISASPSKLIELRITIGPRVRFSGVLLGCAIAHVDPVHRIAQFSMNMLCFNAPLPGGGVASLGDSAFESSNTTMPDGPESFDRPMAAMGVSSKSDTPPAMRAVTFGATTNVSGVTVDNAYTAAWDDVNEASQGGWWGAMP
jgi:hypothetical protein